MAKQPYSFREENMDQDSIKRYNYDEFVEKKFMPLMRFHLSPNVGENAPDFPLWQLDETETSLSKVWSENLYTVVEFGSYT
jgi:hypothetical protein